MDNKTVVLFTTLSAIAAITSFVIFQSRKRTDGPPVAAGAFPFIGHALEIAKGPLEFFKNFFADSAVDILEINIVGKRGYLVRGAENARKIFTSAQFNTRYSPKEASIELGEFHQGILLNTDIESWKYNRKMLVENIARPRFIRSLAPKINSYLINIYPLLDQLAETKTPILANVMFGSMSLDVIVDIVLTSNRHAAESYLQTCIDGKTRKTDFLLDTVKGVMEALSFFPRTSPLLYKFIPSYFRKAEELRKFIRDFDKCTSDLLIARQQQQREANEEAASEISEDLATGLVLAMNSAENPMTFNNAVQILKAAISGGADTSSNTMSFLLYELARHPEISNEIHAEVAATIANSEDGEFNSENIGKLPFLEATILEITRLYSEAQALAREVKSDFVLGDSVLQKDSVVFVWIQGNQVSSEYWENPTVFNPKRFLVSKELGGPLGHGFAYAAFGHGVRKCPGETLALMEIKLIMANLCLRYDFELADPNKPLEIKPNLVLECGDFNHWDEWCSEKKKKKRAKK
ncbi:Cytochrome P450 4d2 [Physocladia obscura]|uniref:Cytochrome P450 4d2 n=1 Tax=Physocladia obscura TaxID=109957 RepID=A0AAD5SWM7_9FUNG|nr:Cytochrome P450 4d2 [Physocladia obscura]